MANPAVAALAGGSLRAKMAAAAKDGAAVAWAWPVGDATRRCAGPRVLRLLRLWPHPSGDRGLGGSWTNVD